MGVACARPSNLIYAGRRRKCTTFSRIMAGLDCGGGLGAMMLLPLCHAANRRGVIGIVSISLSYMQIIFAYSSQKKTLFFTPVANAIISAHR